MGLGFGECDSFGLVPSQDTKVIAGGVDVVGSEGESVLATAYM